MSVAFQILSNNLVYYLKEENVLWVETIKYLSHVIFVHGVSLGPIKVDAMMNLPLLKILKKLGSFCDYWVTVNILLKAMLPLLVYQQICYKNWFD